MTGPTIRMNDGCEIPQLGLGVWQIPNGKKCESAVLAAFDAGYRHIDTASFYGNEESVGAAVKASGIRREDVFVTTKLWNSDHANPERALETSLRKLKLDYVDLYLIHYPVPQRLRSWRAFEKLRAQGKARSIGVSNFTIRHVTELLAQTETVPAINQVEFHPYLYQRELLEYCDARKIVVEAYCPLTQGQRLNDRKLIAVASRYATNSPQPPAGRTNRPFMSAAAGDQGTKSPAQILIRWALQHGLAVIPKSATPARIRENAEVFDFEISDEDMQILDNFNENLRTSWDPTNAP
ncbi:MAG TPA: aldo/keto reductase [Candidatus Limnocylindria bacterium]|nr:aldo/keto reductase [Candidatus Limnocylindria bacterium]